MDKQECLEILNQKIDEAQEETDRSPEGSSYGTLMLGRKEAFSYVRGLLKTLDEPEITTEQAWEKIAEEYKLPVETVQQIAGTTISSAVKKEDIAIRDGCIILNPNLTEPEKPEIPKFVADWIEEKRPYYSLMTMISNYFDSLCMPERVAEWITDNFNDYVKALVNGYTIEKEPVWVVLKDAQYFHAFTGEYDKFEGFEYVLSMYEGNAHTFADKQKAEAVATLVDGVVKEWSE